MPKLLRTLKLFYKKEGRSHLPWRKTRDPYKILVSEIMLQQTQVARVIDYYERWIKKFPTASVLSQAKLSDVLKQWQGLGYNRRAKFLHQAAKIMSEAKVLRSTPEFWESLPGVGHYTARAVVAFAYNKPEVFIETNIRTVFLHSNILKNVRMNSKVSDTELLPLVGEALKKSKMQPRDFYAALMDYGAFLKASGVKLNSRSKHYTKQSKFEGSARQKRAAKLRKLLQSGATEAELEKLLNS